MSIAQRDKFVKAVWALLVPLARLVLHSGLTYREFSEVAKRAFIDVAIHEFGKRGRPTNISRVAVMTGLTRKEISTIKEEGSGASVEYARISAESKIGKNLPSEILQRWYTDTMFVGQNGLPRPLEFDGPTPSFTDLVRLCDRDIPPGAIREELLRVGVVLMADGDRLLPRRREFIPDNGLERAIEGIGYGLRMQAETIAHNAAANDLSQLRFQRAASSSKIPRSKIPELEKRISEQLSDFLKNIDDQIRNQESTAENSQCEEFAVGCYVFRSDKTAR